MKNLISAIERISHWSGIFAACLLLPLIFISCYEVFARYVFGAPTSWTYELGTMMTGAYFILGCAYTLKEKAHIRIDVFFNKFPKKIRVMITLAGYAFLFLPLAWWLSYALLQYSLIALETGERTGQSSWNPLIWPFYMVVFAGFFLLTLQASVELLKLVQLLRTRDI